MIEHLPAGIDGMANRRDFVLEAGRARDDTVENGEDAGRLPHGVSGQIHRIEEISDAAERQRIEDPPGHAERVQTRRRARSPHAAGTGRYSPR